MLRQCRNIIVATCGLLIATVPTECSLLRASRSHEQSQKLWNLKHIHGAKSVSPAAPAPAPAAAPEVGPTYVVASEADEERPTMLPTSEPQTAASTCKAASSCSHCTALPECGWCALEQKCVDGTKLGPRVEQCLAYDFMQCTNIACEARNTCADCLTDQGCGWCEATGKCAGGDADGPFTASVCPTSEKRTSWAHGHGAVDQCEGTPELHSSKLWDGLRQMMYKSQQRIARLAAANDVPAPQAPPAPAAPTVPPIYVMTTWIYPTTAPPSTTVTTTTVTTTTILLSTMPPKPPIKISIDVDQNVKNGAHASNPEQHITKSDSIDQGSNGTKTNDEEAAADEEAADEEENA